MDACRHGQHTNHDSLLSRHFLPSSHTCFYHVLLHFVTCVSAHNHQAVSSCLHTPRTPYPLFYKPRLIQHSLLMLWTKRVKCGETFLLEYLTSKTENKHITFRNMMHVLKNNSYHRGSEDRELLKVPSQLTRKRSENVTW